MTITVILPTFLDNHRYLTNFPLSKYYDCCRHSYRISPKYYEPWRYSYLFFNNIIIIAFKDTIRDFLQSPHCAANRLQHVRSSGSGAIMWKSRATHGALITCNTSSGHHMQHIEHSSRATHRAVITCNTSSGHHMQHIEHSSRATHRAVITCNTSSGHHMQHIEHSSRATHRAVITCNTSSGHHMQHIEHSSRATHRALITCNMSCCVPHGTKGQLSCLKQFQSHLFQLLFDWLNH